MCVCESLTGSKWRRLLLCEGESLGAAGTQRAREGASEAVGGRAPAGQGATRRCIVPVPGAESRREGASRPRAASASAGVPGVPDQRRRGRAGARGRGEGGVAGGRAGPGGI